MSCFVSVIRFLLDFHWATATFPAVFKLGRLQRNAFGEPRARKPQPSQRTRKAGPPARRIMPSQLQGMAMATRILVRITAALLSVSGLLLGQSKQEKPSATPTFVARTSVVQIPTVVTDRSGAHV